MKAIKILVAVLTLVCGSTMWAQSLSTAKMYIEQGRYMDAAKQLRPLADGGNAEAQCLAAELFLDGKGVNKNGEQCVKYATMAADQGYEDAVCVLAKYYADEKNDCQKAFALLNQYIDATPSMKKGRPGMALAHCYMRGLGVMRDEDLAWFTIEGNKYEQDFINMFSNQYEAYKKRYPAKFKAKEEAEIIYDTPEEAAQFPGNVYEWLARQIQYPSVCAEKNIQGRVTVEFVINTDGSIVEEKVLRSPDENLSNEALRVVRRMPKWKPARQKNKFVRMRYKLPIMFQLNKPEN